MLRLSMLWFVTPDRTDASSRTDPERPTRSIATDDVRRPVIDCHKR